MSGIFDGMKLHVEIHQLNFVLFEEHMKKKIIYDWRYKREAPCSYFFLFHIHYCCATVIDLDYNSSIVHSSDQISIFFFSKQQSYQFTTKSMKTLTFTSTVERIKTTSVNCWKPTAMFYFWFLMHRNRNGKKGDRSNITKIEPNNLENKWRYPLLLVYSSFTLIPD